MIREVLWLSAATEDYMDVCEQVVSSASFDRELHAALELLKQMPELGSRYGAKGTRKINVWRHRYGLYYTPIGDRLIVSVLVDQRRDPEAIKGILSSRGI